MNTTTSRRDAGPPRASNGTTFHLCATTLAAAFAWPLAASAAEPASAATVAAVTTAMNCEPVPLSYLQRRVLEKSERGIDALHGYVYITRSIHNIDLWEAVDWAAQQKARRAACAGSVTTASN